LKRKKKPQQGSTPLIKREGPLAPASPSTEKVEKERGKSPPPLNFIKEGKSDPF
jgi:hypothetical protein